MSENEKKDSVIDEQQDALSIVNDPKYRIKRDSLEGSSDCDDLKMTKLGVSRRDLLKYSGAAAAALSMAGSAATGFATGRSPDAHTGYGRTYLGADQFFNREPFRAEVAAMMEPVGKVERPDYYDNSDNRFFRMMDFMKAGEWNPGMSVDEIPDKKLSEYYKSRPEYYKNWLETFSLYAKRTEYWNSGAYKKYALGYAYDTAYEYAMSNADHSWSVPEDPSSICMKEGKDIPPEDWDFRRVEERKMEFKSPAHATKLIKQMGHMFGMSLVGVAKFDERFMWKNLMLGMLDRGRESWGEQVPEHWKSVVVFGVPMFWDTTSAAIAYSSSYDGYFRVRCAGALMEGFIKALGHPARAQLPPTQYEVMIPVYMMLTGLAEYSRSGLVMAPEVGCNVRMGGVITDIEFEYDKPININMAKFCEKCKICADTCPSGAIESTDKPEKIIRGFKRWQIDEGKCENMWARGATKKGMGCRICVGVCPFSRKNTWIHAISRELDARDATGLVGEGLLAMQMNFFKYPKGEEFRANWDGGREATYHDPIWWQRSEDFFKGVEKTWQYLGMH